MKTILELAPQPGEDRSPVPLPVTVLERRPGWRLVDLVELWRFRELLYFLTLRDIKVRYKQTVLGAAWAILQPLATMLVFSLFFGGVAGNSSSTVPYSLFVLAGLVPWMFFSNAIATAGQSVVANQTLVTRIYFPRLIIPMGAVAAGLVDFAISFVMLVLMMAWYGVAPGWSLRAGPAPDAGHGDRRPGHGDSPVGLDRLVSRLPSRRALHGPVLDVRHAVHLPSEGGVPW